MGWRLHFHGGHEDFAAEVPFAIAAGAPGGEVLLVDGASIEVPGEDFFNSGQVVEPGQDGWAAMAIRQTLVDFLTNGVRKTGNFTDAEVHRWLVVDGFKFLTQRRKGAKRKAY